MCAIPDCLRSDKAAKPVQDGARDTVLQWKGPWEQHGPRRSDREEMSGGLLPAPPARPPRRVRSTSTTLQCRAARRSSIRSVRRACPRGLGHAGDAVISDASFHKRS